MPMAKAMPQINMNPKNEPKMMGMVCVLARVRACRSRGPMEYLLWM